MLLTGRPRERLRKNKPLRGRHEIGIRVGKIINKHKVGKHFSLTITEEGLSYQRREQQIKDEALLDGFYVIRTSMSAVAPAQRSEAAKHKACSKRTDDGYPVHSCTVPSSTHCFFHCNSSDCSMFTGVLQEPLKK